MIIIRLLLEYYKILFTIYYKMDKRRVVPEKFLDSTESGFFDEEEELETVLKQFTKTKHGFKRRPSIIERE